MAKGDYDWYCQDCDFHTDKYKPYSTYYTDHRGQTGRRWVYIGTVLMHQDRTGHTNFRRKVGPRI